MNWLRRCWYDRPPPLATLRYDGWRSPLWSVHHNADPVATRSVATTPRTCCDWKFDGLVVAVSAVQAGKQSVRRWAYASRYRGWQATCGWRTTTTIWRLGRKTSRRAARRRRPVRTVTDVANGVVSLVLSSTSQHNLQRHCRDRRRWCRHLRPDRDQDTEVAWSVDLIAAGVRVATISKTLDAHWTYLANEAKASWRRQFTTGQGWHIGTRIQLSSSWTYRKFLLLICYYGRRNVHDSFSFYISRANRYAFKICRETLYYHDFLA